MNTKEQRAVIDALQTANDAMRVLADLIGDVSDYVPEINDLFNGRGIANRAYQKVNKALKILDKTP